MIRVDKTWRISNDSSQDVWVWIFKSNDSEYIIPIAGKLFKLAAGQIKRIEIAEETVKIGFRAGSGVLDKWLAKPVKVTTDLDVTLTKRMEISFPALRNATIGSMTNQVAFSGRALRFVVASRLGRDAKISFKSESESAGTMSLEAETNIFSYTPSANAVTQFNITFFAKKGNKTEEQSIRVTPQPELHSDFEIINNIAVAPDPSSSTYAHITDRIISGTKKRFNPGSEKSAKILTHEVIISGVDLVFEKSSVDNTLYDSFSGRKNIEVFKLYADRVIVKSPLNLPSSQVTIHARSIVFEGEGVINTTPSPFTNPSDELLALDGANGGEIKVFAKNIVADGKMPRFISQGGIGQTASEGTPGENGGSVKKWNGKFQRKMNWFDPELDLDWSKQLKDLGGYSIIHVNIIKTLGMSSGWSGGVNGHKVPKYEITETVDSWGSSKTWPTSGKDPEVMPGKPGEGGDGGKVYLPGRMKLPAKCFTLTGGSAGQKAKDLPAAKAGTPTKACHADAFFKPSGGIQKKVDRIEIYDKRTTHNGAPGIAPAANKPKGNDGKVMKIDDTRAGFWLNPVAAKAFVEFAKDTYLAGKEYLVRETLEEYQDALREPAENDRNAIVYASLLVEVSGMLRRMDSAYDYFGNPAGWVPMLAFEANLDLYKSEIETSARLLFLNYWIERNQENTDQLINGLNATLSSMNAETKAAISDYNAATESIKKLSTQSSNLSVNINDLLNELAEIEERLRKKAKGNLQLEHIIRSSAKLLGGVLQMIPAGQPALGAVGTGISVLADFDPEEPFDTVKDFGSELWGTKLVQEKLLPKVKNSAASFLNLDVSEKKDLTDFDKQKAKKELEAKVKKAIEGEKEVKDQVTSALGNFTVSDEELEEATQRAVADSPEYAEVAEKISNLGDKKNDFAKKMYSAMQVLDTSTDTILNNELGVIEIRDQLSNALKGLNHEARRYASELGRRARARLIRYQYYLVKSYNYLMLEPRTSVDYGDSYMLKAFSDLLSKSEDGTLSDQQYEVVKSVFEGQLNDIVADIIDAFTTRTRPDSIPIGVSLSQRQLAILNTEGVLTLNLMEMGYIPASDDDVRIVGVKTTDAELVNPPAGKTVNVKLEYRHSGTSILRNNGRQYLFRTGVYPLPSGNENTPSQDYRNEKMHWGSVIKNSAKGEQTIQDIVPSPSSASLMNYLLKQGAGEETVNDSIQYYRPSAWGDISIKRTAIPDTYAGQLKSLSFDITFDYKSVADHIRTVNVMSPGGAMPLIQCDTEDLNHRTHGVGNFLRTFNSDNVTKVQLTAPPFFGNMPFVGWKIVSGGNNNTADTKSLPLTPLMAQDGVETFLDLNDRFSSSECGMDFNSWMSDLQKETTLSLELNRNYSVMAIYLPILDGNSAGLVAADKVMLVAK